MAIQTNFTSLAQANANGYPNATATPQYGGYNAAYSGGYSAGGGTPSGYSSTSPAYSLAGPVDFTQYNQQMGGPTWQQTASEFSNLQNRASSLFDSSRYVNEARGLSDMMMSQGTNAANAAGSQYANAARRAGTSGQGAGVARALSLIPAQAGARSLALNAQEFAAQQNAQKAAFLGQLTQALAGAQGAYRSNLAGYNANVLGISNSNAQWQASLAQNQNQFDASRMYQPPTNGSGYAAAPPYAPQTAQPQYRQPAPSTGYTMPAGNYLGNTAWSPNPRLMGGPGSGTMNWNVGNVGFQPAESPTSRMGRTGLS